MTTAHYQVSISKYNKYVPILYNDYNMLPNYHNNGNKLQQLNRTIRLYVWSISIQIIDLIRSMIQIANTIPKKGRLKPTYTKQ